MLVPYGVIFVHTIVGMYQCSSQELLLLLLKEFCEVFVPCKGLLQCRLNKKLLLLLLLLLFSYVPITCTPKFMSREGDVYNKSYILFIRQEMSEDFGKRPTYGVTAEDTVEKQTNKTKTNKQTNKQTNRVEVK